MALTRTIHRREQRKRAKARRQAELNPGRALSAAAMRTIQEEAYAVLERMSANIAAVNRAYDR
jgi:hypothetical protein